MMWEEGGVLGAFSHVGTRGAPAPAVSYNCFPFIVGSVRATQRRSHIGDFLIENCQAIVLSKGCYVHTLSIYHSLLLHC